MTPMKPPLTEDCPLENTVPRNYDACKPHGSPSGSELDCELEGQYLGRAEMMSGCLAAQLQPVDAAGEHGPEFAASLRL